MPKKNVDYNKIVIYKIFSEDDNITDIYVGSTTDFTRRKCNHKSACNNENNKIYNRKLYKMIRDNGGWENWRMIEVEKYPCNDKREAEHREEYWRKNLKAELNTIRCWWDPICKEPGCKKSARNGTDYCINHGGGKRCIEPDCKSGAESPTDFCKKHGGGKRCIEPDCKSGAERPTDYCRKHGGGKRCIYQDCKQSAISTTYFCSKHGEQYTCQCG
jgi:hypothetical protein